jgi:hypothetical protein
MDVGSLLSALATITCHRSGRLFADVTAVSIPWLARARTTVPASVP